MQRGFGVGVSESKKWILGRLSKRGNGTRIADEIGLSCLLPPNRITREGDDNYGDGRFN